MIFSPVKPDFDITAPHRYLQKVTKDRANLDPSAVIFETECRPYKLNWVFVWCLAAVLTENYKITDATVKKNYFDLVNKPGEKEEIAPFRTWHEGVRAGVQTIVALYKIKLKGSTVWQGTEDIISHPILGEKPIDIYFGEGVYDKAEALFNDVLIYEATDEFKEPPVLAGPDVPPAPIPMPTPKPEPVKEKELEKPVPVDESKPVSTWKKTALKIAGVLGGLSFFIGLFLPGWAGKAIDLIVQLINVVAK